MSYRWLELPKKKNTFIKLTSSSLFFLFIDTFICKCMLATCNEIRELTARCQPIGINEFAAVVTVIVWQRRNTSNANVSVCFFAAAHCCRCGYFVVMIKMINTHNWRSRKTFRLWSNVMLMLFLSSLYAAGPRLEIKYFQIYRYSHSIMQNNDFWADAHSIRFSNESSISYRIYIDLRLSITFQNCSRKRILERNTAANTFDWTFSLIFQNWLISGFISFLSKTKKTAFRTAQTQQPLHYRMQHKTVQF